MHFIQSWDRLILRRVGYSCSYSGLYIAGSTPIVFMATRDGRGTDEWVVMAFGFDFSCFLQVGVKDLATVHPGVFFTTVLCLYTTVGCLRDHV